MWERKICDHVEFHFDFALLNLSSSILEIYLGLNQTSMMKLFVKRINSFVPNTPFLYPLKTCFLMFSGGRKRVHWERMG